MARKAAPKTKREDGDGIVAITVQGYKSICDETRIDIAPLTILAGANCSGKTSMMQPVLLLKQTLDSPNDPGPLLLNGANVDLSAADQFVPKLPGGGKRPTELCVEVQIDSNQAIEVVFAQSPNSGLAVKRMSYKAPMQKDTVLRLGMTHEEIVKTVPTNVAEIIRRFREAMEKPVEWRVSRSRCFLQVGPHVEGANGEQISETGLTPSSPFAGSIRNIIHVPGLRGNPKRTYPTTAAAGPSFPGTFEDYTASVIALWQKSKSDAQKQLGQWLEKLGLTWKVMARTIDDTHIELKVGRLLRGVRGGARDLVNVADTGFGVSQSLPVLVALLAAVPGQLVFIEEPEIHLHPMAQLELADILVETANRGVRIVAETHSALLLLGLQSALAEGLIQPHNVRLHWFRRDPKDNRGSTQVSTAELDDKGTYGDWPVDFGQVSLDAQQAYLNSSLLGSSRG